MNSLPWAQVQAAASTNSYSNPAYLTHYNNHEKPIVSTLRAKYTKTLANSIVGRVVWYMEYGYMYYGHSNYATTGYIDCSQFVYLVYKNFGYSITSASRYYNAVR